MQYFDNEPVVKLIESKRPIGLLTLLDEESIMPRATDDTFAVKCEVRIGQTFKQRSGKDVAAEGRRGVEAQPSLIH